MDPTADQVKLRFALRNARAVRTHIHQCFRVELPIRLVRKYLSRWGFTPQRPMNRAFERQLEAVRQWLQSDYPAIAARAKAEGARDLLGG